MHGVSNLLPIKQSALSNILSVAFFAEIVKDLRKELR